jgi:hypothetical protein
MGKRLILYFMDYTFEPARKIYSLFQLWYTMQVWNGCVKQFTVMLLFDFSLDIEYINTNRKTNRPLMGHKYVI